MGFASSSATGLVLHSRRHRCGRIYGFLATAILLGVAVFTFGNLTFGQGAPNERSTIRSVAPAKERPDIARFRARVEKALAAFPAAKASWGVLVADRETGETLYSLNSDRFFAPASNAKIFTTALAFSTLGTEYRYHTTLESRANIDPDGHLPGDLILMGRGDPDLSNRKFPYDSKVGFDGPVDKILAELADAAVGKRTEGSRRRYRRRRQLLSLRSVPSRMDGGRFLFQVRRPCERHRF